MIKTRKELEDSNTGWDFRQITDIVQKRTGIKYHELHIYQLLHKWGFALKTPQNRFVRTATNKRKRNLKKVQVILTNLKTQWHILYKMNQSLYIIYGKYKKEKMDRKTKKTNSQSHRHS